MVFKTFEGKKTYNFYLLFSGHPNILFFISHSGLLGTQEAVYCGVPMLCIPLFADQYQNCRNMVDRGVALEMNPDTVTKEKFSSIVKELIENPRYSIK